MSSLRHLAQEFPQSSPDRDPSSPILEFADVDLTDDDVASVGRLTVRNFDSDTTKLIGKTGRVPTSRIKEQKTRT